MPLVLGVNLTRGIPKDISLYNSFKKQVSSREMACVRSHANLRYIWIRSTKAAIFTVSSVSFVCFCWIFVPAFFTDKTKGLITDKGINYCISFVSSPLWSSYTYFGVFLYRDFTLPSRTAVSYWAQTTQVSSKSYFTCPKNETAVPNEA